MKVLTIFDGCAGSKSATAAFRDKGHIVETLDITGDHDYIIDIRKWHPEKHYDFMWFSPPCTEFSIANNFNRGSYKIRKPDLSIVQACMRIIQEAKPTFWIIENPAHGLRHFIGKPATTVRYSDYGYFAKKPTDLWGNFPWFWSRVAPCENTVNLRYVAELTKNLTGKDRTQNRAMIPYGLSAAICNAVEDALFSIVRQ